MCEGHDRRRRRDLTRDGVDPVQVVLPSHILVNIPKPAPLNDAKFKLGYIDSLFMRMRKDAHDLFEAADVVADIVFGISFVRVVRVGDCPRALRAMVSWLH